MNVRAIFGARACPSTMQPLGTASVVVSWPVRQRRGYLTVGGGQTFYVQPPLHLVEVEEIEPGRGVLLVDNPTSELHSVRVTVVGATLVEPLDEAERREASLIEAWLKAKAL